MSQNGDAEYVKKLIKKRDSAARRIARTAKSLLESVSTDGDDTSVDAARIDRDELEKCFRLFEEVQNEIEQDVSDDELVTQEEERVRVETLVRKARVSASNFLRRSTASVLDVSNSVPPTVAPIAKIKRPEITVPKFSGEFKKWSEFRNVFKSLVIDERAYSDIERMIYLKQAVENKAAEVISNFEISGPNFDKAWEKLRNRYENKRAVISSHLEALCKLPYAKSETDISPLLDAATDAIESLSSVGVENGWELMLCHLVSSKLDAETRKQWELSTVKDSEYPTYAQLEKFLQQRVKVFESMGMSSSSVKSGSTTSTKKEKPAVAEKGRVLLTKENPVQSKSQSLSSNQMSVGVRLCFDCGGSNHGLVECKSFLGKTFEEKTQVVQKRGLCFNCLNRGHRVAMCRLKRCEKCNKKHHILLHNDETKELPAPVVTAAAAATQPVEKSETKATVGHIYLVNQSTPKHVCLPAALVYVFGANGHRHLVRAFLDSGSTINVVSERLAKKLQCRTEKSQITLATLMPGEFVVHNSCNLFLKSRVTKFQFTGKFQIAPAISKDFSSFDRTLVNKEVLGNRKLADNPSVSPGRVDLLIGAEYYEELMLPGRIKLGEKAYLRETEFGWVFIGVTNSNYSSVFFDRPSTCFLTLEANFQKFWLVDEIFEALSSWTEEEKRVDAEYEATWDRIPCGNFLLFLPKNLDPDVLGESRNIAFQRWLSLERRFKRNEQLGRVYNEFLLEYESLRHMNSVHPSQAFVHLPHHPVFKEDSTTTSTRVVFDAAALTSSGYSLNDFLAKGPVLQEDLFSILVRFRGYKVAFTADIEKMYRQIFIQPEDRKYQCILWRHPNSGFIGTYQLNTVTYGTKPASYLATKCLVKLSELFSEQFPESAKVISSDFYMDDLLSGADSVQEAQVRIGEIVKILSSAGFPLRKFASSEAEVLAQLNPQLVVQSRSFEDVEMVSVLGVKWTGTDGDCFKFFNKMSEPEIDPTMSKRMFLSKIFRIYDPLGLLAPVVNALKFLLQDLWRHKLDWDDSVPPEILKQFRQICVELKELENLSVPRWTGFSIHSEIHVFCDASQRGFGAAVYIRNVSDIGNCDVRLVCAKSRVAPLKVVSVPRLELCSALLGAKLFRKVKSALRLPEEARVFAWSDSTIVLSWLYFDSGNWSTFVANRVSKIRDILHPEQWFHVKSENNAADLISRGLDFNLSKLSNFWNGPLFLQQKHEFLRPVELDPQSLTESKVKAKTFLVKNTGDLFLQRFSRYESLISMVCFVMRFSKRLRKEEFESNSLTAFERLRAHKILIRKVQKTVIEKISKLDSFSDNDGIWRLRSRIGKSDLTFDSVYPIILPKDRFLLLLVRYWHDKFFHAGVSFLKNFIRTSYFVLGDLNRLIRSVVHACPTCRRFAAEVGYKPPIGELPACRVTVSQAFVQVGVDFAGPILTRAVGPSRNRGKILFKSYVAIFICMASRAIHVEVVEDLSTKAFLDCLDRFISRRGLCHTIYSDHGTNFVGANRELRAAFEFLKKNRSELVAHCGKSGIEWKFIPERAPHFGGLWESAVKSFKFHFKRVVGTQILSFAELSTLGCRIEAVLNSRPLCTSADNLSMVITPAHLCIGRSVSVVPTLVGEVVKGSTKARYSLVQSIFDRFWTLWSREYLIALRSAYFKKNGARQAQVDDVVLFKEDNVSPTHWPLGKIVRLFPGSDGVARVADVLVNGRIFRRPVVKLVPLLSE